MKNTAYIEHDSLSRPPILHAGDISPVVMRDFEDACRGYFETKEIPSDKHVRKILAGLKDSRIRDWLSTERDRLTGVTFDVFMTEFRAGFLDENWEEQVRRELGSMTQRNETFWDFAIRLQAKNSLLVNTASHLNVDGLHHRLEAGMSEDLALRCVNKKISRAGTLKQWITDVKRIDDLMRAERKEFETIAKQTREMNRRNNLLTEVSNRTNTSGEGRARLPRLTDSERALLQNNEGCFKCRKFFAGHLSKNCPNSYPDPNTYKPLTSADITRSRRDTQDNAQNVPHSKLDRNKSSKIAAITQAELSMEDSFVATQPHPIAVVVGKPDTIAYMPPNSSNVVEGDSDSDGSLHERVRERVPICSPHIIFNCIVHASANADDLPTECLMDGGSQPVVIENAQVDRLALKRRKLHVPVTVDVAFSTSSKEHCIYSLTEWVKLKVSDPTRQWTSRTVKALIVPKLCYPIILGRPFLKANKLVIDHDTDTVVHKPSGVNILNLPPEPAQPREAPHAILADTSSLKTSFEKVLRELLCKTVVKPAEPCSVANNHIAAIREKIETLAGKEELNLLGKKIKEKFKVVFEPIPHADMLPEDIHCRISLKDANKAITARSYSTPRKYREAWSTLIQQHLEAGRIRPSASTHASPAFLTPKSDPNVLPRWVNDYRQLNNNTVTDKFPLPRIDDILADCAKGKIWSKMDMTNAFFQTRLHPDDIAKSAVSTPMGLYEWLVMPMGFKNAPSVHQRRVTCALRHLIGRICHIYLDDIIIWSQSVAEHTKHICLVLEALKAARLWLNPDKCDFYLLELDFLGHHISPRGVEANDSKIQKILDWPCPKSAKQVRGFLGLVRYISAFLPNLAEYTRILTPLTTSNAQKVFPIWTSEHQTAFDNIKSLVTSRECLTTIDHEKPGNCRIFLTCDASDWRTGAVLSWGASWESARPVAFESWVLKPAQRNYPIHEKELLAIVQGLKKWRSDLVGEEIYVYTDHRTLENFNTQKDLSRRQLRWQEYMSQYDLHFNYIRGEDNTVADALSRLPADAFPNEETETHLCAIFTISPDKSFLKRIKKGYAADAFCQKLTKCDVPGVNFSNGLWYVGSRLVIPRTDNLREDIFKLAHDCAGHFGTHKSYDLIRDDFYWPNMRKDLAEAYIPGCESCQRNKSPTTRPTGPLHPLPVPDQRGDSVALDFIGPLPEDNGKNCILTMTDRLGGADIRLIPTRTNATAEETAALFFEHWYCENGLPSELVSDRDKLFVSRFWKALHSLTGVKIKMSTAYHPETDGSSERTNKTVNQCLRFYVQRNQKGWSKALPKIRFEMMNTVNSSTGYTPFQLRLGRSPRIIPPLIDTQHHLANIHHTEESAAKQIVTDLERITLDARDNLLRAKVNQAASANETRQREDRFKVGDQVLLSTFHRRREYAQKGDKRTAKFFPRFDGPYFITESFPEHSTYTLDLTGHENIYPTFHATQLRRFRPNDPKLFPQRERNSPGPMVTGTGLAEYSVADIIDARRRGRGWQFLVQWSGYGQEHNRWLPAKELENCDVVDQWYAKGGKGPAGER